MRPLIEEGRKSSSVKDKDHKGDDRVWGKNKAIFSSSFLFLKVGFLIGYKAVAFGKKFISLSVSMNISHQQKKEKKDQMYTESECKIPRIRKKQEGETARNKDKKGKKSCVQKKKIEKENEAPLRELCCIPTIYSVLPTYTGPKLGQLMQQKPQLRLCNKLHYKTHWSKHNRQDDTKEKIEVLKDKSCKS